MFTHLYLMQGEKIKAWFVSPSSRECFDVESTAFLPTNKFTKNIYTGKMNCSTFFSISEAIKMLVSENSSVFLQCCSCKITQNMVVQLLQNFKLEISFG